MAMFRYFATAWHAEDRDAAARAHALSDVLRANGRHWAIVHDTPGLLVLTTVACSSDQSVPVDARGVVLGTVFERSESSQVAPRMTRFDPATSLRIRQSRGRELAERYWGRYVALLGDPRGELLVLRDPAGALRCEFVREEGMTWLFSHFQDFRALGMRARSINWRHISAHLRFSRVVSHRTGLQGVEQIRAGECVTFRAGGLEREFFWHPNSIYEGEPIAEPAAAKRILQQRVDSCVTTWASQYPSVLHELSGGLDSSVVLACLRNEQRRTDVSCFNMYTESASGDERDFARKAARHAGCELYEVPFRPLAKPLAQMLVTPCVTSPGMGTLKSEAEDRRAEYALANQCTAIFSGQGGDNLFQRRKDALIPAEYLRRRVLGRDLVRVVSDTAQLTGKTVWSVVAGALADAFMPRAHDPYAICARPSFWGSAAEELATQDDLTHPWVLDAARLPSCKTRQIFDVVDSQMFFAQSCEYADIVHPLISQPILECVLRIPCYVLVGGGRERALLRAAFAQRVPDEILNRSTKGDATGYFQRLLLENSNFIRDVLLGGTLVKEGILDRGRLQRALSYEALLRGRELGSLLTALLSETWIQHMARQ